MAEVDGERRCAANASEGDSRSGELAHCLIHGDSGDFLAVDARTAAWLGCDAAECATKRLDQLLPKLGPIDAAFDGAASQPLGVTTPVAPCDKAQFLARVNSRRLAGAAGEFCLVTIRPLGSQPVIHRDALTQLPDRRELAPHRLRWQHDAAGEAAPHALLFLDLDEFKQVNDTHGHALGDRVLVALAQRWTECVRDNDLVVRYGGDEFVVLLAGITSLSDVKPIQARFAATTCQPLNIDGVELRIGVTIGVALADDVTVDLEQLLAAADHDLYTAKRSS